jgi:outer membrane protein assembly factor BamB
VSTKSGEEKMNSQKKQTILNCLYVAAFVCIFFVATLILLIFIRSSEMNAVSPLAFKELEQLKDQARSDPQNKQLHEKIRQLDLAARKQWFFGLEAREKLASMLSLAALTLVVLLAVIALLKPIKINKKSLNPEPAKPAAESMGLLLVAMLSVLVVNGFLYIRKPAPSSSLVKEEKVSAVKPAELMSHEKLKEFWPGFRGIYNDGISTGHTPVTGWGANLDEAKKWKTEIPLPGYSSPIVVKDLLLLTGGDEQTRALFCFSASAGELLWRHDAKDISGSPASPPEVGEDTGYAASTPVSNGNMVFAIFATGDLVATDLQGRRIWAKNLSVPENIYGYSSSLLAFENSLIVQYDNDENQVIYCINADNGETLWKNERDTIVSWSSPTLCRLPDRNLVITINCAQVEAFNLESGELEWGHKIMGGEVAPSATFYNGILYVANEYVVAAAIDAQSGKILWKNDKAILPDVSSPVVFDDMLFLFTSAATISCLDSSSGEILWEKDVDNGFYSSPLRLGDRIVAFDLKGNMLVIKPDRQKLQIEKTEALGVPVLTTPAFVGNKMWVRTKSEVMLIEGN